MEAALHQLQLSDVPKAFNSRKQTLALGTQYPEEAFPTSEWSVSLWMFTNSLGGDIIDTFDFSSFSRLNDHTFKLFDGTSQYSVTTSEDIVGKWVFYQLGSTTAKSYATSTMRTGNQYFLSSINIITLLRTGNIGFFGYTQMQVITI
jgi:hypothetical protein